MAKRKANPAFMKPMQPSDELAEVIGSKPLSRGQVMKKLWEYIHKHKLQDKKDRRFVHADKNLKPIFKADGLNMFKMVKAVNKHLSPA